MGGFARESPSYDHVDATEVERGPECGPKSAVSSQNQVNLEFADQKPEHRADGDQLPFVLFERGAQQTLVLVVGQLLGFSIARLRTSRASMACRSKPACAAAFTWSSTKVTASRSMAV